MEKTGKKKQMADMTDKVGPRNEAAAAAVSRHKVATSNAAAVAVSLLCVRLIFP